MALKVKVKDSIVSVGDTVSIGEKIKEGDKERIQNYQGVIIAIKGNQGERTITVRRIATGAIGVEKIFPVDLPSLARVKVLKQVKVRRSKLYYLRSRVGKAALKLKERQDEKGKRKKDQTKPPPKPRKPRRKPGAKTSSK